MKYLVLLLLAGQAYAKDIGEIKREVDRRLTYKPYYSIPLYAQPVENGEANCAVFAATYKHELTKHGYRAYLFNDEKHAVTVVRAYTPDLGNQVWVLDNRYSRPVLMSEWFRQDDPRFKGRF